MVLLNLLHTLAPRHDWRLSVAHLNHCLRGRASDADEALVRRAAKALSIPISTRRVDVAGLARKEKVSIEMAARRARHDFLACTAVDFRAGAVVLAHHSDDQVELFFLRLLRGSGLESLSGMKWRNPSSANSAVELIRPLLAESKAALVQYAKRHGIAFREDASNRSLDFQRNRIRHELLPLLRSHYQPALDRVIARFMELAGAETELSRAAAARWLKKPSRDFGNTPVAVQRRIIQSQLPSLGVTADFELIERLRLNPGSPVAVAPGKVVRLDADGFLRACAGVPLRKRVDQSDSDSMVVNLTGKPRTVVRFAGLTLSWRFRQLSTKSCRFEHTPGLEVFDADRVGSSIQLRHWRPGDRFQPIGMTRPVKLQDLFVNLKIPRERRGTLVVAATGSGELFWVEELRISERFKVTRGTTRRLHWSWKRL